MWCIHSLMADVVLSSVVHPQAVVFLLPHVDVVVHHVLEPVLSPPLVESAPRGGRKLLSLWSGSCVWPFWWVLFGWLVC